MRRGGVPVLAGALLLALAGCRPADAGSGSFQRETLPDGRVVVRYPALPAEPAASLAFDLRIGALDGEAWETFGQVRALEAGADGTIWVLDAQVSEIRAFGPDGAYRGTIARRGEGPGEIRQANGLTLAPDGTLWVQDHGAFALLRLRPEGGEVERRPMLVPGFRFDWDGVADHGGALRQVWDHPVDAGPIDVNASGVQERAAHRWVMRYDPASEVADSIFIGEWTSRFIRIVRPTGGGMSAGLPFDARTLWAIDRGGHTWSARSDAYRITRIGPAGDTVLVIEVDERGPPVSAAERAAWFEAMDGSLSQVPGLRAQVEALVPERKPVLWRLLTDDDGRLWVQREVAEGDPLLFDVFDTDGEFLGRIEAARELASYPVPVLRGGRFHGVLADSLGVQYVVRAPLPAFTR